MPPRILALALPLLLGIVLAFARLSNPQQFPLRPSDGASIFRNSCAPCHGSDGRGNGPVARALKQEVPDLTRLAQRNGGVFPAPRVKETIMFGTTSPVPAHGSKAMPIWGPVFHEIEFDEDMGNVRLENVTNYLRSIQRK